VPGRPETRYARSGEAHLAYQVTGAGPFDLVVMPGFISHLDLQWEGVAYRRFVRHLAGFARVIRYDQRGTGLSDLVATAPTLEQRADDLGAVLDAAGSARAVVLGYSEGGPAAIRFAVREPTRTLGLVLYGTRNGAAPKLDPHLRPSQFARRCLTAPRPPQNRVQALMAGGGRVLQVNIDPARRR
jgi:pimeloyl-ACP methyl ester carboxylesterase